jgi:hypothetical protein
MAQATTATLPALWRDEPARGDVPAVRSRFRRRATLTLVVVALVVAVVVVALLSWLREVPRTTFVPLWSGAPRKRALPPLAWADQDRAGLRRSGRFRTDGVPEAGFGRAELLRELADLPTRPTGTALVVHLSGRALARGGETYLVPADAVSTDAEELVPFRDVLRALAAVPNRHKLLIVDIMAPLAEPRLGLLRDDVAAAVQDDLAAVPDPHRLVLCACSPGQTSFASEDLRRSVFGHYLEQGLAGHADGWGPSGKRDRLVTVRELAAYVRTRVRLWAVHNRQAWQTPVLLGDAPDFPLVLLGKEPPAATAPPPAPAESLPDWLLAGWQVRQRLWDTDAFRADPTVLRALDLMLLETENDRRGGLDGVDASEMTARLARAETRLKKVREPLPDAPSLGLMAALGRPPDPEVAALLKDQLDPDRTAPPDTARPTPSAAPPVSLTEALKGKTSYDVAAAVFELAADDPAPRPERLRLLDAVLRAREPQPQYAETLWLRRLATLADEIAPAEWPEETVRRSLEAVRLSEMAAAEIETRPWVAGLLETGAQHLHEGQVLLLGGRGYAPPVAADRAFRAAADAFRVSRAHSVSLRNCQASLDRGIAFLAAYPPYLERDPRPERRWLEAVQAVAELEDFLNDVPPPSAPAAVYLRRDEDLRQKLDALEGLLSELRRPFAPERLAVLARGRSGKPQVTTLLELEAVLATPFPKPQERAALWQVARAQAHGLHEEALRAEADAVPTADGSGTDALEPVRDVQERAEFRRAARRARLSIGLLRLGGWPAVELARLERLLETAESRPADHAATRRDLDALADALGRTWAEVPARVRAGPPTAVRDRLSRVAYPEDEAPAPRAGLHAERLRDLLAWKADRLRYESRDLAALGLLSEPAARFQRRAVRFYQQNNPSDAETYVAISSGRQPIRFLPDQEPPSVRLELRTIAAADRPAGTVRVLYLDDWFEVGLGEPGRPAADGTLRLELPPVVSLPMGLRLRQGENTGRRPPRGLLVQVRVNGRAFHHRLPVNLRDVTDRLDILLTDRPEAPAEDGLDELRLRPLPGRQTYHLFVRNRSPRTRNLSVQLAGPRGVLPGGAAKLTLRENETLPVRFGAPSTPAPVPPTMPQPMATQPTGMTTPPVAAKPATADEELPELGGWLEVRLLDSDEGDAVVATRRFDADVAAAEEYLQVASIRFDPVSIRERGLGGAVNRLNLTVRAVPGMTGPPCPVEAVLVGPDGRTPLKVRRGTLRGEVTAGGGDVVLIAEEVELPGGTDGVGSVHVTVDGRERAFVFRVNYLREGNTRTPQAVTGPTLRLRAPSTARSGPRFAVGLEVDHAPPGATVEVSLGRFQDGKFVADQTRSFPTPQRRHVGWGAGPDGTLLFDASVRDWSVNLDTTHVVGRRHLRARLLDADGAVLRTVLQSLLLDETPPEGLRFIDPPTQTSRTGTLTLTVAAGKAESGIDRVTFFRGKATPEGKPPPGAALYPGEPVNPERTLWSVAIPLTEPKTGPLVISAQSVSGAGLETFTDVTIEMIEGDPENLKPGRIEGVVVEGEIAQANLEVVLTDDKGLEKGRTKTADGGKFAFDKVPSGKYLLSVSKPATKRKGNATVFVEPGKTATTTIKLLLP